jgi:hypothetical protein
MATRRFIVFLADQFYYAVFPQLPGNSGVIRLSVTGGVAAFSLDEFIFFSGWAANDLKVLVFQA